MSINLIMIGSRTGIGVYRNRFLKSLILVTRDAIRRVKKDVLRDDLDKVFKCLFLVSDRDKLFGTLLISSIRNKEADGLTYLERVFWFGVTGHYEWIFG